MTLAMLASFLILHFTFYIALAPPAQAQIPLSPIQPGLRDEIIGVARQAAVVGLGERALADLDIRIYILRIVSGSLTFVGLILIAIIVYGGFMYMTSGGSEEKTGAAKKILARAAIGMTIILSSYAIVLFINRKMTRIIFYQMSAQVQNCSTRSGQATCCQEWLAFQSAGSIAYTRGDLGGQAERNRDEARELYDSWVACRERAADELGIDRIDANLFD